MTSPLLLFPMLRDTSQYMLVALLVYMLVLPLHISVIVTFWR